MNIDWFTFVAQIVNFLILVGLLRWLLYGPIIAAMEHRERSIAQRWNEADQKIAEADERIALFEEKTAEFNTQREELLHEASREALEHRERLTRETRDDVESKRSQWIESLQREQAEAESEIRERLGEMAIESSRHTLIELADEDLESRVTKKFIAQLRELPAEQRDQINTLLQDGKSEIQIRSAFELGEDLQNEMRDTIHECFGHRGEIVFDTLTELICGIQLDAGGYSIEWNIDDFIGQIRLEFGEHARRHR